MTKNIDEIGENESLFREMEEAAIMSSLRDSLRDRIKAQGDAGFTSSQVKVFFGRNGRERIYLVLREMLEKGQIEMRRVNARKTGPMRLAWVWVGD